jgi:signal transduction histidine kinase
MALISGGKVSVIGPLTNFSEPCTDAPQDDWHCRVQYRIPGSHIRNAEAIGLGIILFGTEVSCSDSPNQKIVLTGRESDGRISGYLRNYQVLNLDRVNCDSDLIVKNWSKKSFNRHGYSQAPAAIGPSAWIDRTKRLVEVAVTALLALAGFTFFIFYLVLKTLQRVTYTSLKSPPFDDFQFFWLGFIVLTSGYVFELLLPMEIPFQFVQKLTHFFGLLAIIGPCIQFAALGKNSGHSVRKVARALTLHPKHKLWPLIIICAIAVSPPYFRYTYPYVILFVALLALAISITEKSFLMSFYSAAALSDGLKILMLPYFPASRLTITYMLFIYSYRMRKQISILEENARFDAGAMVALQISHDIRSPLAALRTSLPLLEGTLEIKELVRSAISRVSNVADQILQKSKSEYFNERPVVLEDLESIISKSMKEKRAELADCSNIHIREEYPAYAVKAYVDPSKLAIILSNLVNNSVESLLNSNGTITVSLSTHKKEAVITIHDSGMGIPPELLQRIGERGTSSKRGERISGSGIGLYHARKTLFAWNGSLEIASSAGRGTLVTLRIPRQHA